jgi:hypothetical protein
MSVGTCLQGAGTDAMYGMVATAHRGTDEDICVVCNNGTITQVLTHHTPLHICVVCNSGTVTQVCSVQCVVSVQ